MEIGDKFQALAKSFEQLLGPEGCPWDKKQTHESLKPYMLEEAYELLDAIESNKDEALRQELGDVLLQVMLHSEIARHRGAFDISQVVEALNEKIIRRHPHVFGDAQLKSAEEVSEQWQKIKDQEKQAAMHLIDDPFANIPKTLPSLQRSYKIGQKSIRYNFDWSNVDQVLEKVDEELAELREAIALKKDKREVELELGDILFTLAQVGRRLEIDPEQALRATNQKFETRFLKMRELCHADGKDFTKLSTEELENYWVKAKKLLKE